MRLLDSDARRSGVVKLCVIAIGILASAACMAVAVQTNLARGCMLHDFPYLEFCNTPATARAENDRQLLRERVQKNPGEFRAWLALARAEQESDAALAAAATLAPNEPNVLLLAAAKALKENRLPAAVPLLVRLVEDYHHLSVEPARVLARLIASGQGFQLLRPHLAAGSRWLGLVVATMHELQFPAQPAFPLVAEAASRKAIPPSMIRSFVSYLKTEGNWVDAYSLWVTQQPQPAPVLHNGGFEQKFEPDGFDWEVAPVAPGRAGALVSRRTAADHGEVLEIQYTGRAMAIPTIKQPLFLAPGKYTMRGDYMTSRLQTEQGLAWVVKCGKGYSATAGKSPGLVDTGGAWRRFEFDIAIPAGCGEIASLQLETFAPFEAAAGFRGKASFDDFSLTRKVN